MRSDVEGGRERESPRNSKILNIGGVILLLVFTIKLINGRILYFKCFVKMAKCSWQEIESGK